MKNCFRAVLALVSMSLAAACGEDPNATGGTQVSSACVSGDCDKVTIETPKGKAPGALIAGGSCTGMGDDAPCQAAFAANDAAGMYNHDCLPDDPKPQCASDEGVWGCYMLTLDQCPLTTKCTADAQCHDGNSCTEDVCASDGECRRIPMIGATCTDGNACTDGDMCAADGSCSPGDEIDFSDGLFCNGEESCDPETGDMVAGEEVVCEDADLCDGTMACSEADSGACVNGPAPEPPADDSDTCTGATCDPATGVWSVTWEENGTSCDSDSCSTEDQCWNGVCTPTSAGYTGGNEVCAAKPVDQMACVIPWDYCDPLGEYEGDTFKDEDDCVWRYKDDGDPCDGQGSGYECWRPEGSNVPVCVDPDAET